MSRSIEDILAEGGIECEYCGEKMLKSPGCKCSEIECNGVRYERIKYGEGDYDFDECCHDCGAKEGHYHHSGCDNEVCPVCGEQLIGCDCDLEFIF